METKNSRIAGGECSLLAEAKAFAMSIILIRRAQGKSNPKDFEIGSEAWEESIKEFAADVLRLPPEDLKRLAPIAGRNSTINPR